VYCLLVPLFFYTAGPAVSGPIDELIGAAVMLPAIDTASTRPGVVVLAFWHLVWALKLRVLLESV
jgi:hypothetical protein